MPKIVFKAETEGDDFKGFVNQSPLSFTGTKKKGTAEKQLGAGEYRYVFVTTGPPGSDYKSSIEGSSPAKTISGTIGPAMKAGRNVPFKVTGADASGRRTAKRSRSSKSKGRRRR